jgi:2-methylfumaryl-CoA hydratase
MSSSSKTDPGRLFEDFRLGEVIRHPTPRTLHAGDASLYLALTGDRHALLCADPFARACGLAGAPLDPWLVFHTVFGKTVPDISRNAVANLGYAEGRWLALVHPGETLRASSEVIGLKRSSNGRTGVVWVRTQGLRADGAPVLEYVRWVLVHARNAQAAPGEEAVVPTLAPAVAAESLWTPPDLRFADYPWEAAGARWAYEDYEPGERIDHGDGMTVEEAEHQLATRLYQNTAKVHFDAHAQADSRFGRRLIYGGVVISLARALSFNGLQNAALTLALNGGRHVAPLFAGDTVYAWSSVLDKVALSESVGALRLRLVAAKNTPCADFPDRAADGADHPAVILDLDYWAATPRRG